jgi:hypothetical protein
MKYSRFRVAGHGTLASWTKTRLSAIGKARIKKNDCARGPRLRLAWGKPDLSDPGRAPACPVSQSQTALQSRMAFGYQTD